MQRQESQVSPRKFEEWLNTVRLLKRLQPRRVTADPVLIPVVVHIIHNGEDLGSGVNIPENQILTQIEVLNEDFRRLNQDTVNTPSEFAIVAGSLNVEFVLAKRDPDGFPTNGIIRKQGSKDFWNPLNSDNDQLKSESYWPAEDYLNIWVCNLSGENLGYAQFPDIDLIGLENEDTENRLTDGVVIDYTVFGSSAKGDFDNLRVPYDKGRTTSHEVGHWLGLLHNFADEGLCNADDYVDDTPLQESSYNGICPDHPVSSCGSVDMFQNYMDYTADECMNLFTNGQADRMSLVLDFAPRRASLKDGLGAQPPDIEYADLNLVKINSPKLISCFNDIEPMVTLQNMGTIPIHTIRAEYGVEGQFSMVDTLSIDTLKSGQQLLLLLQPFNLENGSYKFQCEFTIVGDDDFNPDNNSGNSLFLINDEQIAAPVIERFDDDIQWTVFSTDLTKTWEFVEINNDPTAFINLYNYPNQGVKDYLISPVIDFSNTLTASVRFDLSYANNEGFVDSLTVLASNDCGETFSEIYAESGDIFKLNNSDSYWEPTTEDDWRTLTLDLSAYAGSSDVRLAFVTTNGFGNNLYLDNIEFFMQSDDDIIDLQEDEIRIFPNPSKSSKFNLAINTFSKQDVYLSIFNSQGQKVFEKLLTGALNQNYIIDLAGHNTGIYIIKMRGETISATEKLILRP